MVKAAWSLALWAFANSAVAGSLLTLDPVQTTGLSLPVAVRHAGDGSDRLFVVEKTGRIRLIDPVTGLATAAFLDLSALVSGAAGNASDERGLLGLAFHPDYAVNGRFFVNYSDVNGDTVVARYQVDAMDPDQADPNSGVVLMRIDQDFANHNGGDLAFGPDGYLYIGLGDGGGAGDPCDRAQTLDPADLLESGSCAVDASFLAAGGNADARALLGKMLRIDVDTTTSAGSNELCAASGDGSAAYGVPVDNPFAAADGACDEVWALGLRNPFRYSFDRLTGDLWIADVGQNRLEEIDLERSGTGAEIFGDGFESRGGLNYGWDCREGDTAYGLSGDPGSPSALCTGGGTVDPVLVYAHSGGRCSVTGGYRYRGATVTALADAYVYGDYCTGEVFIATPDGDGFQVAVEDTPHNISSFGEDEDGEVYLVALGGGIYRLTDP